MYTAATTTTSTIASTNTNTNSTTVVSSTTATATTVANIDPQSFTGITLDLILKRFMECEDFLTSDHKDWNTISRMVPHTTPLQCAHRFEELLIKDKHMNPNNYPSEGLNHQQLPPQEIQGSSIDPLLTKKAPIGHPKFKGFKDKEHHTEKPTFIPEDITEKVSMMIIRVYDEAKDVEQHFQCPRNILIEEMKYFKEYLSADPQQLREDFDISVHCDIQIFDWLIRYAKRNLPNAEPVLGIDSNNIISLLISSDFLKMDSLVQKCISYIHDNLSDILRAPSNMNCINDKLVTRIAELFNHNEIEEIKDKKDKFKSKLFSKKIERLFDSSPNLKPNPDSPGSGVYLFRCCHCQKILLPKYAQRIRCAPSRLSVNEIGELVYNHDTDMTFDINEFILALKSQMVTWRNVYWKLWGLVNYLHCTWCNEMFPCAHFGHCPYHPEEPQFQTAAGRDGETVSSKLVSPIGHYPCCNQTVCRFDPANLNLGCQARDHIVKPLVNKENSTKDTPEETCNLFKDLIAHRDIIGIPYNNTNDFYLNNEVDVFSNENNFKQTIPTFSGTFLQPNASEDDTKSGKPRPVSRQRQQQPQQQQQLQQAVERWESSDLEGPQYSQDESEDEIGDNEVMKAPRTHVKKNQVNHTQKLLFDAPEFQPTQKSLWNTQRSVRHNQDAQRQEDQRRMKEMIMYLTKLRLDTEKVEKPKKEYPAGSFSRIEGQWRNHILPNMKNLNQPFARAKFRFGPIK